MEGREYQILLMRPTFQLASKRWSTDNAWTRAQSHMKHASNVLSSSFYNVLSPRKRDEHEHNEQVANAISN